MLEYKLSELARLDMVGIADYSVDTWGVEQALRYIDGLEDCFSRITRSPGLGRRCDRIRPGYRRAEYGKHVVIYRADHAGVFIGRILHERMLPANHLLEDMER